MQTRALYSLLGTVSLVVSSGCGGSAECGPGTLEQDGVCVVDGAGGGGGVGGGGDNADDLGGNDPGNADPGIDQGNPADPGPGDDPGGGQDMPGDPGPGGDDPGNAGDPGDPGPGGGDPAAGCDAAGDCTELAHQILDAINAARAVAAEGGCAGGAFAWDDGVAAVALGHANAMAAAGQISVDDPGGTLGDRLDAAGVGYSSVGEVYGRAYGTPAEVVEQWMGSEHLRPYLVSCDYTLGGIGAAAPGAGGSAFLTGTFVAP